MLTFLPPLPAWTGLVVMGFGICGALFGIAMAITQTDIKRSLAYSTVENIGIIYFALGLWLYCGSSGFALAAQLALAGALLHIWNHSLFKSLLFMGAGAVLHATGTREMSSLGGLMRKMPGTGSLMIVGAAAVSALPPLNGLVSELLIYLGLLHAGQSAIGGQAFLFMIFTVLLAIVGGLVLLTMTRMIGIVFSGTPRSSKAEHVHECAPAMLMAMAVTALSCLLIGIFPQQVLPLLAAPMDILAPHAQKLTPTILLPFNLTWSVAGLLLAAGLIAGIAWRYLRQRPSVTLGTWGCAFNQPSPAMSYTAGGYSQFIQDEIYLSCMRPQAVTDARPAIFAPNRHFRPIIIDAMIAYWFAPVFHEISDFAIYCRRLQAGNMNIYLAYIFLATLLLLGWSYFVV